MIINDNHQRAKILHTYSQCIIVRVGLTIYDIYARECVCVCEFVFECVYLNLYRLSQLLYVSLYTLNWIMMMQMICNLFAKLHHIATEYFKCTVAIFRKDVKMKIL